MKRVLLVALAVGATACAGARQPVPLVGSAQDLKTIAGDWVGDYSSAATGRSGSIRFTLRAQGDSAFGDVVMVPVGLSQPLTPWRDPSMAQANIPHSQVLTIRFVRVQGGRVSGTLDPYADPVTGDRLITSFVGDVRGDTISGTYTTRLASGEKQTGRWTVQRGA